jgi:hypothetical protein
MNVHRLLLQAGLLRLLLPLLQLGLSRPEQRSGTCKRTRQNERKSAGSQSPEHRPAAVSTALLASAKCFWIHHIHSPTPRDEGLDGKAPA